MHLIADTKKHQKGSIIMSKKEAKSKTKINKIEITNDKLTGRAGLTLFNRYLTKLKIVRLFEKCFGNIRKNQKGASVSNIFHQITDIDLITVFLNCLLMDDIITFLFKITSERQSDLLEERIIC